MGKDRKGTHEEDLYKHFEVLEIGQILGSYDGSYHVLRDRRVKSEKFVYCSRAPGRLPLAVPAVEHTRCAEVAAIVLRRSVLERCHSVQYSMPEHS